MLMHLGSLRTIGVLGKKNFKHILLNNNSHESVGGQQTYAEGINFKNLIKSMGYKRYFKLSKEKNMRSILSKFLRLEGPSFLEVKIKNGSFDNLRRPKNLQTIKKNFFKF